MNGYLFAQFESLHLPVLLNFTHPPLASLTGSPLSQFVYITGQLSDHIYVPEICNKVKPV